MDRRDFLHAGTLSALSATVGAAHPPAAGMDLLPFPDGVPDMDGYLARVDAGMARIGEWSSESAFPGFTGDRAAMDALARKSLQTLYLTGMFGDLPIEGQAHPGMQERMWNAMPLIEEASDEMTAFISSRTDDDFARVQAALRDHQAGPTIMAALDAEAARVGVSAARRAQTSRILTEAEWRLRNQPPSLIVGEYRDKMEKLGAVDPDEAARVRWIAAQVGDRVFWQQQRSVSRRDAQIRRGGRAMGIAIVIAGIGALIIAAGSFAGVFLITVGAIWFLIGLIMLLVGLGMSGG